MEKPITLAEAGIDKHLADRARKYAAVPSDEFESILADRRDRIETENKRVTVNLIEAGPSGYRSELEPWQETLWRALLSF